MMPKLFEGSSWIYVWDFLGRKSESTAGTLLVLIRSMWACAYATMIGYGCIKLSTWFTNGNFAATISHY